MMFAEDAIRRNSVLDGSYPAGDLLQIVLRVGVDYRQISVYCRHAWRALANTVIAATGGLVESNIVITV